MTTITRTPAGVPSGGQFAPVTHAEPDLDLGADFAADHAAGLAEDLAAGNPAVAFAPTEAELAQSPLPTEPFEPGDGIVDEANCTHEATFQDELQGAGYTVEVTVCEGCGSHW